MPADLRNRRHRRRRYGALATGGLLTALLIVSASSSVAWAGDSGEVTGLSTGSNWNILLRLLIPTLILLAVISLLAALPRLLRRPRYRPGKPWPHDPLWFAGAENPERALAGVRPARRSGGASADW